MIDLGKKLHHRLFDSEHRTSRSMNRFLKSERSRKTVIPCISFIIYLIIIFEKNAFPKQYSFHFTFKKDRL